MLNDETEKMNQSATDFSLADKERLKIENPRLENLYNHLSEAAKNSYSDPLLLSNAVFAKSDLPLSALDDYLEEKEIEPISFLFSLNKIIRYFTKSVGWLFVSWVQGLAHGLSRQKFVPDPQKPFTLIDINLTPKEVAQNGDFNDRYFPGLEGKLKSKGMNYAYVPKFFGEENPIIYYKMFRRLKEKKRPVLSNCQLLCSYDYLKMFVFILVYPSRVLRQIGKLGQSQEDNLLRFLLWDTLDYTAVKNFARQLYGRHISGLNVPALQCISWYENQPQDKNFYKGLRSVSGKVKIYGAQLYLWPSTLLNLHVEEAEIDLGLIPDRILVNGNYYLREGGRLNFKIGPSMRYLRLFQTEINPKDKMAFLVLLPFFDYEIDEILKLIGEAGFSVEVFIKFHPATDKKKYVQLLKGKMQIVEDDLYALFNRVGCVIGKSTGALVEAASLGIPVINIETGLGLSHNYLPKFGKGIIWQSVSSATEVVKWGCVFRGFLKTKPDLIKVIAEKYKAMFFCEPTDQRINEAFELEGVADNYANS